MYKYPILLYWSDDDNCFITSVPDLPGCMSDGKTPEEAIRNTQVITNIFVIIFQNDIFLKLKL